MRTKFRVFQLCESHTPFVIAHEVHVQGPPEVRGGQHDPVAPTRAPFDNEVGVSMLK